MSAYPRILLGVIAESVDYGVTASATRQPFGPKFLRITDIQHGRVDWPQVPWCECSQREIYQSAIKPGDIVFARTGATTGKSFLIRECPDNAVFASYLIRVRLGKQADPVFVSHFFQSSDYWSQITKSVRGAAQPGVNATSLRSLEIPLPPLPEQRRIAAILDQAEALRAKRRAALAKLDTLAQSIFIEMFGDPIANERKWPIAPISNFIARFEGGKNLVADDQENATSHYRVLKISAVTSLEYLPSESKAMPPGYIPPSSHIVRIGDLLFSRANTTELIGATAMVRSTPPNHVLPDKLWRLVWREDEPTDAHWALALFRNRAFRGEIGKRATGTSGSMKNISQGKVLSIRIGLPPLALQQSFGREFSTIEGLLSSHRASLAHFDALFASLQHRAFRGEL